MNIKEFLSSFSAKLFMVLACTAATTYLFFINRIPESVCFLILLMASIRALYKQNAKNAKKVTFMLNAIESSDFSFVFSNKEYSRTDKGVNLALNRITAILQKAKAETIQKEKYYELILNSINTGILVIDEKGSIYQTNKEAVRLLGLTIFTHVDQLSKIAPHLPELFRTIPPEKKQQTSYATEQGVVNLSIRTSEFTIKDKQLRILAINDIYNELEDKEIDSWIRLTRVLTHEIMNSITPITSLSDALLTIHPNANSDIRSGLETISATSKGLISFVNSYRQFTRIPAPEPSLFYVQKLLNQVIHLVSKQNEYSTIEIEYDVTPDNLIAYADEKLINQVILNLLKNAMQAIGSAPNGKINIRSYKNTNNEIIIAVTDNGPGINAEIADQIFIPFFSTKENGSGIGLSLSKQIMKLSGGNISLKSYPEKRETTFTLTLK